MDLIYGAARVKASRINDPSRSVPGDVAVRDAEEGTWERIIEVRDKIVTHQDLIILASRAADASVGEAIMIAVAAGQPDIPIAEPRAWAAQRGVAFTMFREWEPLIRQVLLWGPIPALDGARRLPNLVQQRLMALEVSEATVSSWAKLFASL